MTEPESWSATSAADTCLVTDQCDFRHWDDPEHLALPVMYEMQFGRRERNGAPPLRVCARCVAEQRHWSDDVLWVRDVR